MNHILMLAIIVSISLALLTAIINLGFGDKIFQIALIQITLALITEVTGIYYQNTWIYNIYLLFDIWLISIIGVLILKQRLFTYIIIIGSLFCTALWLYNAEQKGLQNFAYWSFLSSCVLNSFTYIAILIQISDRSKSLVRQPIFWLSISVVIYYGCNIPCFSFLGYLIKFKPAIAHSIYAINMILECIRYILVSISFTLLRPKSFLIKMLPNE